MQKIEVFVQGVVVEHGRHYHHQCDGDDFSGGVHQDVNSVDHQGDHDDHGDCSSGINNWSVHDRLDTGEATDSCHCGSSGIGVGSTTFRVGAAATDAAGGRVDANFRVADGAEEAADDDSKNALSFICLSRESRIR